MFLRIDEPMGPYWLSFENKRYFRWADQKYAHRSQVVDTKQYLKDKEFGHRISIEAYDTNTHKNTLLKQPKAGEELKIEVCYSVEKITLTSHHFFGELRREDSLLSLYLLENKDELANKGVLYDALINGIRLLAAYQALKEKALLLHSVSIGERPSKRSCLFFGRSGDGKSTLGALHRRYGGMTLSCDLNILKFENNIATIEAFSFAGECADFALKENKAHCVLLGTLKKSVSNEIKNLEKSRQVSQMMRALPFVAADPFIGDILFDIVEFWVEHLPVVCFSFDNSTDPWLALDRFFNNN